MNLPVPIFDAPNKFAHEVIVIRADEFPFALEIISAGDSFENIVIG